MSTISKEIIRKAIKGDADAIATIYDAISSELYKICLRYSNNNMEAQDMFHDGFLYLLKKLNKYSFKGSFIAWTKIVMKNFILEQIRKNKNKIFIELNEELYENIPEINDNELQYDTSQIIEAIQKLPQGYKTVFNLYVFENLSHKEIAELLNISVSTSKSQYHKAKNYIRKLLKKNVKYYEKIG